MDLLSLFRRTPSSANVAKERLRIIVAQERSTRGGPDYLPLLRSELLDVIRKYVNVDVDAIQVNFENDGDQEVLELSVALPERQAAASRRLGVGRLNRAGRASLTTTGSR